MSEMNILCNKLIKKYKLYWQFPVITEKTAFIQQKDNPLYIGLPWATIIDKKININGLLYDLVKKIDKTKEYITCCQHIHFRLLFIIFKVLNIKILYASHKIKNEDIINGIKINPCPLYAVNLEDKSRNKEFKDKDFENCKRDILYSFMGSYKPFYLTNIRKKIFKMKHPKNTFVKYTGNWHFENIVYKYQVRNKLLSKNDISRDINNTRLYNILLSRTRYSLCPSGSGPNSIRFWESLGVGSIPILLADTLDLPYHKLWNNAIIFLPENKLEELNNILSKITKEKEKEMRKNCLLLYKHFRNNFLNL